jgi:hypothetical protein
MGRYPAMKFLKHILVVIALVMVAMPCCHAADHHNHEHESTAASELCASHTCACHSCDQTPCSDEIEMPQERTASSQVTTAPFSSIQLFVFTETKPVVQQAPLTVTASLASLQTVQLLI